MLPDLADAFPSRILWLALNHTSVGRILAMSAVPRCPCCLDSGAIVCVGAFPAKSGLHLRRHRSGRRIAMEPRDRPAPPSRTDARSRPLPPLLRRRDMLLLSDIVEARDRHRRAATLPLCWRTVARLPSPHSSRSRLSFERTEAPSHCGGFTFRSVFSRLGSWSRRRRRS
jgi:hypothetical protein